MRKRKRLGLVKQLVKSAAAIVGGVVAVRTLPDLIRYIRIKRMAGPRTPPPRETEETMRSAAQAPRRADSETRTTQ